MKKNRRIVFIAIISFTIVIILMGFTIINIKDKMDNNAIDLTQNLLDNMSDKIATYHEKDEDFIKQNSTKFKNLNHAEIVHELNTIVEHHDYLNAIYLKDGVGVDANGKSITYEQLPYHDFKTDEQAISPAINGPYGVWEMVYQMPCDDQAMLYVEIPFSHYSQGNDLTFYNKYGFAALIDASSKKIVLTSKTPNVIWNYMQDANELLSEVGFDEDTQKKIYENINNDESIIIKGNVQGEEVYLSLRAVEANAQWYLCGIIPVDVIQQESGLVLKMLVYVFIWMIVSLMIVLFLIGHEIYHNIKKEKKRYEKSQLENAIYTAIAEASDQFICLYDKTEGTLEKSFYNHAVLLGLEQDILMKQPMVFHELLDSFSPDLSKRIKRKEIIETCSYETNRINPMTHEKQYLRLIVKNISIVGKDKYIFFIADISHDIMVQESLKMAALDAKQANQAKSDFLSKMSHEIRTPMNAIMGMSELALHNLDHPDKLKDYLRKITQSSTHLLGLINDILDLSKIESGKMALYEEKFILSDCISEVYNIISLQAENKHQSFHISSQNVIHDALYGDMLKLKQILINLLNNAVKYTPEQGHIDLIITEKQHTNEHLLQYEFQIIDDGIGMSKEFLNRIGQPFEQEKNQFYGKESGTGLGLSIVKNIVSIMGGVIDIKSELQQGTTICVQLAFKESENDFYKEKDQLAGMRVFLVDDDPFILNDVSVILNEFGIEVDTSLLGIEAFHQIEDAHHSEHPYDIIIIDRKLPDIDGVQLAQLIRERIGSKIPIVFITAYDYSEIEEKAYAVGVNDFIEKPLFKSRLYYALIANKAQDMKKDYDDALLKDKHILLVEDNELNLEIAKELLEMKQVRVDVAHNGQEAVDIFNSQPPFTYDVILMDIQMPVMNGYEATSMIRQSKREDAICVPIIAMSANTYADDIQTCLNKGMNAHIAKPISLDGISKTIISLWNQTKDTSNEEGRKS